MRFARRLRRAGPLSWSWLVVLFLLAAAPTSSAAQVPDTVPADTVPTDTLPVDTLPTDTVPAEAADTDTVRVPIPPETMVEDTVPTDSIAQDSLIPVPPFPRYRRPGLEGWGPRRWDWDRQDLLRYHSLSVLDLLQRIPGLHTIRMGDFGQPAGISTLGGGGGRVRVFLDGFELDPLGNTAYDLQHIALGDLESIRVERRFDGIRIDLIPMRLPDVRPLSAVEAATGVFDTKLLRGMLMRGFRGKATLSAAFDQASSRGVGFDEAFSFSSARASLSYALGEETALQAEIRSENVESGAEAVPVDANRRTMIVRGRSEPLPGLTLDAMLGRIQRRPEEPDPIDVELSSSQGAVRVAYDLGRLWAEGAARMRSNADALGLAATELEARAGAILLPWLVAEGEVRTGTILGAEGTHGSATARIGPLLGLSAFATVGFGQHAMALVRDTTVSYPVGEGEEEETETRDEPRFSAVSASASGLRLGADRQFVNGSIGAAAVLLPDGLSTPLGLRDLDRGFPAVEVEEARGIEGYASLPVPFAREYLRLEGWFTWWSERGGRFYVPEHEGRVALTAHGIFYGGDLEPSLRVEGVRRGSTFVPIGGEKQEVIATLPYNMANLQLEIRILDVRAFFVFDNLTSIQTATDLPERPLPGARFYYGLRWTFRN